MTMISSLEDRILDLLHEFLAAQVPFDEFESRFHRLYPDAETYPVISDSCDLLFSNVLERLSWASAKVLPDEQSEGWTTTHEFRSWLQERLVEHAASEAGKP